MEAIDVILVIIYVFYINNQKMNKNLIKINDILDELKEENCRLKTDLLLANKCIEILSEMKFFLDSIREKFGETLDSKLIQTLNRLDERFSAVVACRQPSSVVKRGEPKERRVVEKRLSCDWVGCGFTTDRQCRLRAHRNYHTGSRPFQCPKCGKSFVGRESLRTHEKSHERRVELKIRVKRVRLPLRVLADEKTFRCSQCSYSCLSRQSLYEHRVTHRER